MTYDELNDGQRAELKQRILEERDNRHPDGPSWGELANAGEIISDEEARKWAEGMEFSEDDFTCSSDPAFRIRITWSVHKTFQVLAASREKALDLMRRLVDAGDISCWDSGWEADDGPDMPKIELEDGE